ncbi:hypothetical protein [Flavobacterium sp.]|uniref:hypothetical protein n=1 Tax=Flavobacterium sp. TaxID=239 RepID=UPI004048E8D0
MNSFIKYYILVILFISYSCKKKAEILINNDKIEDLKSEKIRKVNIDNQSAFEKIEISSLPKGNIEIINFFKEITYNKRIPYISDFEEEKLSNLEDEVVKYLTREDKISMNIYKYPQKNNYDFGSRYIHELDSIKTNKSFYIFSNRLPNIGNNKIYLTHSIESINSNTLDFYRNIDLVILNKNNLVINSLNLNYVSNNNSLFLNGDIPEKHFFIDKDYYIHIKYFLYWGEESISTLAYIKYKIQEDGSIIRYFDQKEGIYKSYIEEGTLKNNTKEGKWKEYLGGHDNMYAILNYKKGIVDGKIEIFDANDMPDMADPEQRLYPRYVLKLEGDKYIEVE